MNMHQLAAAVTVALASGLAQAQTVETRNGVLVDGTGRSLYTFAQDAPNRSHCNGPCAAAWPPFVAQAGETPGAGFSLVERADGTRQWALDGRALYYYAADVQPGDLKGDGQGGVWHAVRAGAKSRPAAADAARPMSYC